MDHLTAVAVTDYHADHTNGLPELLGRVQVDRLYLPQMEDEYGVRDKLTALAAGKTYRGDICHGAANRSMGESSLTIYPRGHRGSNEQGLTYQCSSGEFDLLITGDMSGQTELALAER